MDAICPACGKGLGMPMGRRTVNGVTTEQYQCVRCDALFKVRVQARDEQDDKPSLEFLTGQAA